MTRATVGHSSAGHPAARAVGPHSAHGPGIGGAGARTAGIRAASVNAAARSTAGGMTSTGSPGARPGLRTGWAWRSFAPGAVAPLVSRPGLVPATISHRCDMVLGIGPGQATQPADDITDLFQLDGAAPVGA